jgi:hypothetical protein
VFQVAHMCRDGPSVIVSGESTASVVWLLEEWDAGATVNSANTHRIIHVNWRIIPATSFMFRALRPRDIRQLGRSGACAT